MEYIEMVRKKYDLGVDTMVEGYRVDPPRQFWRNLSNYPYRACVFLALLTLLALGYAGNLNRPLFTLVAGIVALAFLVHFFIEVQSRYHHYATFLLCILAGGFLNLRFRRPTAR